MHVDVILRVARKMFPVYDALLIGMNSASPLLQGRAEPKNDLPVLFCDLRKVYIYISILAHTYQYCSTIGASRIAMLRPCRPPWMECPFCLHRYIVTYASGLPFCWTPSNVCCGFLDAGWRKWCRSSPKRQQQLPSKATFLTFMHLILSGWPLRNSSLARFLACPNFAPCAGSCARPRSSPIRTQVVQ